MGRKLYDICICKVICFIALTFVQLHVIQGQDIRSLPIDSLVQLDFNILFEKQYSEKDSLRNIQFAKAYLQKAKNLDSISEMARGYFWFSFIYVNDIEKRIVYIDSGLAKVKNTEHVLQTGAMCNTKGIIMQLSGDYDRALEYYLEGLENSRKMKSKYYISVFRFKIAGLKRKLGKYTEAKSLYKKCLEYEKTQLGKGRIDSLRYLMTLSDLVSTYRLNKEIDSASYFHNMGITMSKNTDIKGVYTLNEGILKYYDEDYKNAIVIIKQGIQEFLNCKYGSSYGYHNLIYGYFFLGKSYNALRQPDIAIKYFKKIDSIIQPSNDLISEARPAYSEMIEYYDANNDNDNQLYYINKLVYNDSLFHSRYKSTTDKLNAEFDTPILISKKEDLIQELRNKNHKSYYIIFISLMIIFGVSIVLFISYRKNKLYKKRFDELISSSSEKEIKKVDTRIDKNNSSIDISKEVVESILEALRDFEKNNGFLEINLTSTILAKKMNTNSKYLTKVIKHYRDKNFSPYINDLRLNYIIDRLKKDIKLHNYTIKAIATEAGFNSAEVFSKAFYKKTGIYPSYFINQLNT